jgi:uncharacterized protein YjbI with pentapeptide repeats
LALRWLSETGLPERGTLSGADLRRVVLIEAHLGVADLSDADLRDADLRGANLEGAEVTDEQLAQAASLKGAIMPDGTKHDCLTERAGLRPGPG